jgi:hypothetical protein
MSNYSAIVNLHTLQITRAQAKPSQSAFTSRFPVIDLNNGDSSASVLTSLLSGEYPTTELLLQLTNSQASGHLTPASCSSLHRLTYNWLQLGWCPRYIIPWHGHRRKHRFQHLLYCCAWIRCHGNLLLSESLLSNWSTHYNIFVCGCVCFSKRMKLYICQNNM